jgi:type I restriction enzyme, S subunit
MKLNYKKLGDYIRLIDERNKNLEISNLLGINIQKKFMPSVANTSESDLTKYKIIRKGQFAYSAMQVGRDETVRVVLYSEEKPAIISPAYLVFEVIDLDKVLPEYLMMYFQRPESDRFGWFISDGSVRSSLEWERFCEIEIPIPDDIEIQKNVVAVYNELLRNQKSYEGSLDDLQLICDTYIENLAKKNDLKRLGDYIEKIVLKNSDDKLNSLVGISERKEFRTPSGKVNKENLSNHLIVNKDEFAYIPRMNPFKPLAVALSVSKDPILVSASYVAFKIINTDLLLPEFLLLFFKRTEFDRYAAYNAWSSTRDTFDWNEMCEVKLPIPNIDAQNSIVVIHHVLESRKKLNEDLKNMITPLCPVLMKGVVNTLSTT